MFRSAGGVKVDGVQKIILVPGLTPAPRWPHDLRERAQEVEAVALTYDNRRCESGRSH